MVFLQGFFDNIFFFKDFLHPALSVAIISLLMTFISTLAYKFLTNQEHMKSLKEDLKLLQAQMKEHRQDKEKFMSLQKLMMEKNLVYMKHSFRPALFTLIPFAIIFTWVRATFGGDPNPALIRIPLLGGLSYIWVYLIVAFAVNSLLRKLFKIH